MNFQGSRAYKTDLEEDFETVGMEGNSSITAIENFMVGMK